jgi:hypothetical protein
MARYLPTGALRAQYAIARPQWTKAYFAPATDDYHNGQATADIVYETPREPKIIETGVFDHRGDMMLRVLMPIKLGRMGFGSPMADEEDDHVCLIMPASQLQVSDDGLGASHVPLEALEEDEEEEPEVLTEQEQMAKVKLLAVYEYLKAYLGVKGDA